MKGVFEIMEKPEKLTGIFGRRKILKGNTEINIATHPRLSACTRSKQPQIPHMITPANRSSNRFDFL